MNASSDPQVSRAIELARSGRVPEAIDVLRRVVQKQPGDAIANSTLGRLLAMSGQMQQAAFFIGRACQLNPTDTASLNNYGTCLSELGQNEEAVRQYRKAVAVDPRFLIGWLGLSSALAMNNQLGEAIEAGLRAVELGPDHPHSYMNAGTAMLDAGRVKDALDLILRGHARVPMFPPLHSASLIMRNYVPRDRAEVFEAHRRFGALRGPRERMTPAATAPLPDRPLRVGVLSSEIKQHSVAYFLEPLLAHRDRTSIHLIVYNTSTGPGDATTKRVRAMVDAWTDAARLDDAQLDAQIRKDAIDVLIETSGHSAQNRLAALAAKPAPVIITAIGYPHTTGLAAVDYRLVDSRTDPAGSEAFATERLLRLDPCFLCYAPPDDAPDVAAPPSTKGGAPTFGSFNAIQKLSDESIGLFARVMRAVPGSRLVLKNGGFHDPSVRSDFERRFGAEGITPDRLELLAITKSRRDHLAAYARVDVALDTTPYHGTTTTCEALWMGVPVVTLIGESHASRVGLSLLAAIGREAWCATTRDGFIETAAALTRDPAGLAAIRGELRGAMLASPLCAAREYAARFWSAVRGCWKEWCATRAAGPR